MAMNYFGSDYQRKQKEDYASPLRSGGTETANLAGLPRCFNSIYECG